MACLTPTEKEAIRAQIVKIDALIATLYDTLASAIPGMGTLEYRFDSGDGSQKTIRRSPQAILDLIEQLETSRNRLARKLAGTLNVSLRFSRRDRGYGRCC